VSADQRQSTILEREWSEWRRERERQLSDPHGLLAATGLHWLTNAPTRYDDVPGAWSSDRDGVRVHLADGETLTLGGVVLSGPYNFGTIEDGPGVRASFDDAVVEIAKRADRVMIRPRHPDHELVREYRGTPTFPFDERWRVTGRLIPFDAPRRVTVDASVEGLHHEYESPGQLEFELDGATYRLTAFSDGDSFDILFRDATSGVTTYGATRTLAVEAPDADGRVTLDFNRTTNLYCAYTDFSTCPLPPPENRLSVAVEAGEKIPYERQRS
jgi:uncharacterized protein (DUF1684 family)